MRDVFWSEHALDDADALAAYIATDRTPRPVAGSYEKSVIGLPYNIAYALQSLPTGGERVVILPVIHDARNWPECEWPE